MNASIEDEMAAEGVVARRRHPSKQSSEGDESNALRSNDENDDKQHASHHCSICLANVLPSEQHSKKKIIFSIF